MNKKERRLAAKAAVTSKTVKTVETPKAEVPVKKIKKVKVEAKADDKTLDKNNAKAIVAKAITKEKDLKYVYPVDCDTLAKRKKYRAEVRRKMTSFEKQIAKLQTSDLKEDKTLLKNVTKEADSYAATVYAIHS